MRSARSGLVGATITGVISTFILVVGCSADGTVDDLLLEPTNASDPTDPNDPDKEGSTVVPPKSPGGGDGGGSSTPARDAGKPPPKPGASDAGKDSGPSAPNEGDPCPTPNEIFKRSCGFCGTQEAICLVSPDGGPNFVSPYGECTGQVEGGCMPGTVEEVPCGDCGTQKRTCNQYCAWSTSTCQNQPPNHCTPGSVELLSAGCPANEYRTKTCKADCTWDNVTACSEPPTFVNAPPAPGGVASTIAILKSTKTIGRLGGTCGSSVSISMTDTPYAYVEVRNPNPKAVTVSIYNSQATPSSPIIDTIMAAYDGATIPTTDTQRKNCIKGVGDSSTTALTGDSNWASLDGTRAVTIAPGASVQVYFAAYQAYSSSNPSKTTGLVKLNVRTESVAP
jgi:hypothetical protein